MTTFTPGAIVELTVTGALGEITSATAERDRNTLLARLRRSGPARLRAPTPPAQTSLAAIARRESPASRAASPATSPEAPDEHIPA